MKSLFLLANSVCDIACTYCFYHTGHLKRSNIRIKPLDVNHVAERIIAAGFDTVILTGGEPLKSNLKHETYTLIRELKKKECKVIINTSGAYLDENDLDTIIGLGVDRVDVSIDSCVPSIHNEQRGHIDDAVWTIETLIYKGYRNISTTTVVTERSAVHLIETIELLRKIGVEDVRVQRVFLPDD